MSGVSVNLLAQGARVALLLGALSALSTAAIWTWQPEWVEAYENRRLEQRLGPAQLLLERAQALQNGVEAEAGTENEPVEGVEADPEQALELYKQLEQQLRNLSPGDRLEATRRETYSGLRDLETDPLQSSIWAERWAASDPQSVEALVYRADSLYALPESRSRGRTELEQLFASMPGSTIVAESWIAVLEAEDRYQALLTALAKHYQRLESSHWKLTWDEPQKIPRPMRGLLVAHKENDQLRISWKLESSIQNFRLYMPPHATMALGKPTLSVWRGPELGAPDMTFEIHPKIGGVPGLTDMGFASGMVPIGYGFNAKGRGNSFFEFQLSKEAQGPNQSYRFDAPIKPATYDKLAKHVHDPRYAETVAKWKEAGQIQLADWVSDVRLNTIAAARIQLFYANQTSGFRQALSRSVAPSFEFTNTDLGSGSYPFTTRIEIPSGDTLRLRLDLPDLPNLTWQFQQVNLELSDGSLLPLQLGSERTRSLEAAPIAPLVTGTENNQASIGAWSVTGLDPWFEITLPDLGSRTLQALLLEGAVQ